jgi:hypothetical protein
MPTQVQPSMCKQDISPVKADDIPSFSLQSSVDAYSRVFRYMVDAQQFDSTSLSILYNEDFLLDRLLEMERCFGKDVSGALMYFCGFVYPKLLQNMPMGDTRQTISVFGSFRENIKIYTYEIVDAVCFNEVPLATVQCIPLEKLMYTAHPLIELDMKAVCLFSATMNEWRLAEDKECVAPTIRRFLGALTSTPVRKMFPSIKYHVVGNDTRLKASFLRDVNRWHKLHTLLDSDEEVSIRHLQTCWDLIILHP